MRADARERLFESLVRACTPELYRTALWLSGDAALAEDLLQETYARAWRGLGQLRDPAAARAWLFSILRREFLRLRGDARLRHTVNLDDSEWEAIADADGPPSVELADALQRLPDQLRWPLLLQVLGGFSAAEIAQILSCSPDAALQRVSRARRMLRNLLDLPLRQGAAG